MFFGYSAQNINAQSSNDAQRIIGTWTGFEMDSGNVNYTFNANGTFVLSGQATRGQTFNGNYFVTGSRLFVKIDNVLAMGFDIYFSSNGRTLFLQHFTSVGTWLEKQ